MGCRDEVFDLVDEVVLVSYIENPLSSTIFIVARVMDVFDAQNG